MKAVDNCELIPLFRQNDQFIMEGFLSKNFEDLDILNLMRMSIKAMSVSDIFTTDGKFFTYNSWNLIGSNGLREDYNWTRNPGKFNNAQISLWQRALKKTFGCSHVNQSNREVHSEYILQDWTQSNIKNKWKSFYSGEENMVYIKEGNKWRAYRASNHRTRRKYERTEFLYQELHQSANQLTTCHGNSRIVLEKSRLWYYSQPEADPVNYDPYEGPFANIDHAFLSSAQSPRILIDEYKLPEDKFEAISEALQNKKAILVSDESYYKDNEAGGSEFILTPGKTNKNRIIGTKWSPGIKEDQNPYRSELVGINGGLLILEIKIKFFNIKEGRIEIVLDGESALNQAKEDFYQLKSSQSCFDILLDIRNHIKLLPNEFNIEWKWVESHQKEKKGKMDWYA